MERAEGRAVSHAVREEMDGNALCTRGEHVEKPREMGCRPVGAVHVAGIGPTTSSRWPAVENEDALEPDIVLELRRPEHGLVKGEIVPMDEDEKLLAASPRESHT